jgi:hypothetical protein
MTLGGHTGLAHFNKYFCLCHPNSGSYCYGNHILFYLTQMRGQSKDILFLQSLHFKSVKKCQIKTIYKTQRRFHQQTFKNSKQPIKWDNTNLFLLKCFPSFYLTWSKGAIELLLSLGIHCLSIRCKLFKKSSLLKPLGQF